MSKNASAALPIAYVVLRILIVLNWIYGACILALLLVMPNREWIISALDLAPGPDAERTSGACAQSQRSAWSRCR